MGTVCRQMCVDEATEAVIDMYIVGAIDATMDIMRPLRPVLEDVTEAKAAEETGALLEAQPTLDPSPTCLHARARARRPPDLRSRPGAGNGPLPVACQVLFWVAITSVAVGAAFTSRLARRVVHLRQNILEGGTGLGASPANSPGGGRVRPKVGK